MGEATQEDADRVVAFGEEIIEAGEMIAKMGRELDRVTAAHQEFVESARKPRREGV